MKAERKKQNNLMLHPLCTKKSFVSLFQPYRPHFPRLLCSFIPYQLSLPLKPFWVFWVLASSFIWASSPLRKEASLMAFSSSQPHISVFRVAVREGDKQIYLLPQTASKLLKHKNILIPDYEKKTYIGKSQQLREEYEEPT